VNERKLELGSDDQKVNDSLARLRERMEKAAFEDELTFLGKLARQIELTKEKLVLDVKNSGSRKEAELLVEDAKFELLQFLDVCKDISICARYVVADVTATEPNDQSAGAFILDCRLDEPDVDWEERGKKTRNITRRVEHSFFRVDQEFAKRIKKGTAILVRGIIDVLPCEKGGKDESQLPYLYVVSADYEVLSGRLAEAGAKNNRIAKLLIENYSITIESDEEKNQRLKVKQDSARKKVQFSANSFVEKVQELFKERKGKLADCKTSAQRDDVLRTYDRAFNKYLATCNGLSYSMNLKIEDVRRKNRVFVAECSFSPEQPSDDFTFGDVDGIEVRSKNVTVLVKESVAAIASPGDLLVVNGVVEVKLLTPQHNIDDLEGNNDLSYPLMHAGRNTIYFLVKDVDYQSEK
jgi:ribose 1,5-bisphosphokinase PhnN